MKSKYLLPSVAAIVIAGGIFYGGFVYGEHSFATNHPVAQASANMTGGASFSPFWKVWNVLNKRSIYRDKVDSEQMVWGATEGLAASLDDPYTIFFPPQETKSFKSEIRGDFGGVGIKVGVNNHALTVIAPLPDSPAKKAGIRSGDVIAAVDGKPTPKMTMDGAVASIRGKIGTPVKLTIIHKDATSSVDISVTREKIEIPTVKTQVLSGGIYKIDLYSFTSKSPELFRKALRMFKKSGDHKLILDLRGNPGGFLESAVDMASYFLPVGSVVVKEESGGTIDQTFRSKGYDVFSDDLQVVILVDGGTASAAEILSGALSEHGVATLVGEKTFGKGSVQELVPITSDTALKVTVAEWLTPNGTSISEGGLTPDVTVKMKKSDLESGNDPQLKKAIEILSK